MDIIFLDHQGVLYLKEHQNPGYVDNFDSECIISLNNIIRQTDIEIVISSDWKNWISLDKMKDFYLKQKIIKFPINYTKNLIGESYEHSRSLEILNYVNNNKINKWLSIDDLNMSNFLNNFIHIKNGGIVKYQNDIISFFNNK